VSIYATLWHLQFPRYGDDYTGCEWIGVWAQGVPDHIGSPTPGAGYEDGDPYASFLPPAIETNPDGNNLGMRAVVFVTDGTPKTGQEYVNPLLVLSGREYEEMRFDELYLRLCRALRGDRPRRVAETWQPDGSVKVMFADGSTEIVRPHNRRPDGR
jgi:hypothetical protein